MAAHPERLNILISGSGIAGTALAYMLARQPSSRLSPRVTVVERSPVPRTTGQAVDIRGPAVQVIKKLGLEPEVARRHTSEVGLAFINANGEVVGQMDSGGDATRQIATTEYEILRGDLAGLLVDGVDEAKRDGADVRIVYGETVSSLDEREDGVHVTFSDGKLDAQVFDVVVGADGIASPTRKMIFGDLDKKENIEHSGVTLAFYSIPRTSDDDNRWRWCILDQGLAMHLRPHGNGRTMGVYLSTCAPKAERTPEIEKILHSSIDDQKAFLRGTFHEVGWQSRRFLDGLDTTDDFYMSHWSRVVMPQWHKGHCAILGDSAFATMGVGTSFALLGAYLLAGELSTITRRDEIPAALQTYERLLRRYVSKHATGRAGLQWMNPQTSRELWWMQTLIKTGTKLRLPQLAKRFAGFEKDSFEDLQYSDYGWTESRAAL